MDNDDGHPLRDGPSPTVEPAPVSPVPASVPDAMPANAEMVEGYMDGFDLNNPEPNDNRSHSYRHGFANGRADKLGKTAFPTAQAARILAQAAMEKDNSL